MQQSANQTRLYYAILWLIAILFFLPVFWIILAALKTPDDILAIPPKFVLTAGAVGSRDCPFASNGTHSKLAVETNAAQSRNCTSLYRDVGIIVASREENVGCILTYREQTGVACVANTR